MVRACAAVALVLGTLLAPAALAAPVSLQDARDAIAIYEEGKSRAAAGEHEAAYLLFVEADRMYPGALPKLHAARSLEALGRRKEALASYRAFLAARPENKAELVAEAEERIAALDEDEPDEPPPAGPEPQKEQRAPAPPQARDDGFALRVSGFVLLGLTLGTGAGLAASAALSELASTERAREEAAGAVPVLVPITAVLAIATAVVLPLGYRQAEESEQAALVLSTFAGPSRAGLSAGVSF